MLSGSYTAISGMLTNQRSLGVTTSNITNTKTNGYEPKYLIKATFDQQLAW